MTLYNSFLHNVFDIELPKRITDTFVVNGDVDLSKIFSHPALKLNVFYCHLWKYIFKTFPSCHQYSNFLQTQFINLDGDIVIRTNMIDDFLNGMYIIKLGLVLKFNILEFSKFAHDLINRVENIEFLKNSMLEKMEYRYDVTLDRTKNMLLSFFNICYNNTEIIKNETLLSFKNPLTDFELDLIHTTKSNSYQNNLYIINQDVYFMNKVLNHPVVVVDLSNPTNIVEDIIKHVSKEFGKKCVVFSKGPIDGDVFECKFQESMYRYIPRIAPWCLMITDKTSRFHTGLAMQYENNVLCILIDDVPKSLDMNNYNRVISICNDTDFKLHNNGTFWKHHIKYINPATSNNASNNILLFVEFIYNYAAAYCETIPPQPVKTNKLILLIDNRENDLSVISCKCALVNTTGWHCRVITSKKSSIYYERHLPMVQVRTHQLLENQFDIDVYNSIMEDIDMWKGIKEDGYENVLIIQDDGIMIRPGVDKYLDYDYVGAPWADVPDNVIIKHTSNGNLVGNGGFSLRKVQTTIDLLERYGDKKCQTFYHNINRIPEDVYYMKWLTQMGAKFPSKHEASFFSMEQVINVDCIGFHKFWCYHPFSEVKQIFKIIWESLEGSKKK